MMRNTVIMASLFVMIVYTSQAAQFTQQYEINSPIRIKTSELYGIINSVQSYLNIDKNEPGFYGGATFESDKYTTRLDIPVYIEDTTNVPDNIFSFYYYFKDRLSETIDEVIINLSDRLRIIKVVGNDYNHVVGLLNVIREKIEPYESGFGGPHHRQVLAVGFFVSCFAIYSAITWTYFNAYVYMFAFLTIIFVINSFVFFPSWGTVFPGTLITYENLSFIEKYSHLFTFLGFVLSIFPLLALLFNKFSAGKRDKTG